PDRRLVRPAERARPEPRGRDDGDVPRLYPRLSAATSAGPSRCIRERGTTWSNPAARARSRTSGSTWAKKPSTLTPWSSPPAFSESTSCTPSNASVVRSTTRMSIPPASSHASDSELNRSTSWPACSSAAWTFEPKSRSGITAPMRAMAKPAGLLGADPPELLADGLGATPHLRDLHAPAAHLAHRQLARDPRLVEQPHCGMRRRDRGGVAKAVRHEDPEVPVVVRVRLGVARDHVHGGVAVARLVLDPQVELEVGPVVRKRVDDLLERVGEAHRRGTLPEERLVQQECVQGDDQPRDEEREDRRVALVDERAHHVAP